MRQQSGQVRRGSRKVYHERCVVGGGDPERIDGHLASDDGARILDDVDHLGVLRGGCGIDEAPQRGKEIRGDHAIAV